MNESFLNFFRNKLVDFPIIGGILAQLISLFCLRNILVIFNFQIPVFLFLTMQILIAFSISIFIFKLPKWFGHIAYILPLGFYLFFTYLKVSNYYYGVIFLILALTFSHTLKERVPLYLSNNTTFMALKNIIKKNNYQSFVDLGSGLGGVVRSVSELKITSHGVETAPTLWFFSSLLGLKKGSILRQNIWDTDLSQYEIIYAFLSPAIMDKLYLKVLNEMKPGSVFISNSFQVFGVTPSEIIELNDKRQTKLYLYKKV